jgi:hypothetical protein
MLLFETLTQGRSLLRSYLGCEDQGSDRSHEFLAKKFGQSEGRRNSHELKKLGGQKLRNKNPEHNKTTQTEGSEMPPYPEAHPLLLCT